MSISSYIRKITTETALLLKSRSAVIYLSDGMPRSGSTLVYNIMRLCLREIYGENLVSGWVGEIRSMPPAQAYCIKIHGVIKPVYSSATFTSYTYRDLRTALVSGLRKFDRQPTLDLARSFIRKDQQARRFAHRIYKYEQIVDNQQFLVSDLARGLGCAVEASTILARLQEIKVSNDTAKPESETQMHGGHATGTGTDDWRTVLSAQFLEGLYSNFSWWFEDNGYSID